VIAANPFGGPGHPFGSPRTGGSAATTVSAHTPVPAGATAFDPSSIETSTATSGLYTQVTMEDVATVSRLPNLGDYFSCPAQDNLGTARAFAIRDPILLRLWCQDSALAVDHVIWAALTVGALSDVAHGWAVGLQYTASGMRALAGYNIGAGWVWTDAGAVEATTVGVEGRIQYSSGASVERVSAMPMTAAGAVLTANTRVSISAAVAILGGWDTLSWGCWWATGVGGSEAAVAKFRPVLDAHRVEELEDDADR
jgi:hypothetical protein